MVDTQKAGVVFEAPGIRHEFPNTNAVEVFKTILHRLAAGRAQALFEQHARFPEREEILPSLKALSSDTKRAKGFVFFCTYCAAKPFGFDILENADEDIHALLQMSDHTAQTDEGRKFVRYQRLLTMLILKGVQMAAMAEYERARINAEAITSAETGVVIDAHGLRFRFQNEAQARRFKKCLDRRVADRAQNLYSAHFGALHESRYIAMVEALCQFDHVERGEKFMWLFAAIIVGRHDVLFMDNQEDVRSVMTVPEYTPKTDTGRKVARAYGLLARMITAGATDAAMLDFSRGTQVRMAIRRRALALISEHYPNSSLEFAPGVPFVAENCVRLLAAHASINHLIKQAGLTWDANLNVYDVPGASRVLSLRGRAAEWDTSDPAVRRLLRNTYLAWRLIEAHVSATVTQAEYESAFHELEISTPASIDGGF